MRILVGSVAAAAFALGTMSAGGAAPCTMTGMMHVVPHCTAKSGPVVWWMASAKTYYLKGSSHYGKGTGTYACRATAVARGGHPGMAGTMGGSHGMMGGSHGMMGGSHGTMGGSHGSPMPMTMTMAPRAMPSASPPSGGNPMSGGQGNTGAPGAGGQIPNNPGSTSNNSPSPSPHP